MHILKVFIKRKEKMAVYFEVKNGKTKLINTKRRKK